jgi:hypothetical protein
MESNWAAEHLQTIRTLMERSAVYRRALAPITTFVGVVGIAAAIAGWALKIEKTEDFTIYWMAVSVVVIAGAFFLVRRQALKNSENFWSPPTRRVAQAMFPALLIGLVAGVVVVTLFAPWEPGSYDTVPSMFLIIIWTLLYGLSLLAAGFFMPRGVRLFGWGFLIAGFILQGWMLGNRAGYPAGYLPHLLMGVIFGASHLAYGIYLYFTEPRKNET